jgi:hypothetical protein
MLQRYNFILNQTASANRENPLTQKNELTNRHSIVRLPKTPWRVQRLVVSIVTLSLERATALYCCL